MKTDYLTPLTKKIAVITGIVGVNTALMIPAIALFNSKSSRVFAETPSPEPTELQQQAPPAQTPPGIPAPDSSQPTNTPTSPTDTPTSPTDTPTSPTNTPTSPTGTPISPSETTPSTNTPTTPSQQDSASGGNVLEVAQSSGNFGTFAQAVEAAGLSDKLSSGKYTLFVPTDEAFSSSLPSGSVEYLLKPENKDLLRQVLSYHVVPRELSSRQLKTGTLKTLGGGVAVRVSPKRVVLNNASVVKPNIEANNGVIHGINRVLLPRQLRNTIASKVSQQTPSTPTQDPSSTQQTPSTPTQDPSTPSQQPSTPTQDPSTPSQQPSTPTQEPTTPSQQPSTPTPTQTP